MSTPDAELRLKQIAALKRQIPTIKQINSSLFTIFISNTTINISLPPTFPTTPPIITCAGQATTSVFFDKSGNCLNEKLRSWNKHLSLGKLVQELVDDIISNINQPSAQYPPTPPKIYNTPTQQQYTIPIDPNTERVTANNPVGNQSNNWFDPGLDREFPGICNKSWEELKEMLETPLLFKEYFEQLPQVKNINVAIDNLVKNNVTLAESTLEMKGRLQSARDILQMKQEGFFKVRSMFEILLKERSDELQRFHPSKCKQDLKNQLAISVSACEELQTQQPSLPIDEYLRQYKDARKIIHNREFAISRLE